MQIKDLKSIPFGLLLFDNSGDMIIVKPKPGFFPEIYDFLHCHVGVEQEITHFERHLKPCMVCILVPEL